MTVGGFINVFMCLIVTLPQAKVAQGIYKPKKNLHLTVLAQQLVNARALK
jgi:hypothetical protein